MTFYGPGFKRMAKRLGPERLEELRQSTLKHQEDAKKALSEEIQNPRNRDSYKDYPRPKPGK